MKSVKTLLFSLLILAALSCMLVAFSACQQNLEVVWLYADGSVFDSATVSENDPIPDKTIPYAENDPWLFLGWNKEFAKDKITYTEKRTPNKKYFVGNVFQIAVQNLAGTTTGWGSAVVINKEGWFVTNSHVMKNAYSAVALFEIEQITTGESFTKLDITLGGYNNSDKDIFIGKIDNYSSIASYYQPIAFTTNHGVGKTTYSLGYPDATPYMEIHKGEEKSFATSSSDKLLSGVQYISSTSFIMPGSSGGVLVNENLEVIGLTTIVSTVNGKFERSYSISTFNFQNQINATQKYTLKTLAQLLHPAQEPFVRFWFNVKNDSDFVKSSNSYGDTLYTYTFTKEGTNNDNTDYTYTFTMHVSSDFLYGITSTYYWSDGDRKEMELFGIWSPQNGFNNFKFNFNYTFSSTKWYSVSSSEINYSENISLTLNKYKLDSSFSVSKDNITYAKENFNSMYETLLDYWNFYSK